MWKRSFVATTVAIGGTVDDALAALGTPSASAFALVSRLRAPQRPARATALAETIRDIVVAVDQVTLR